MLTPDGNDVTIGLIAAPKPSENPAVADALPRQTGSHSHRGAAIALPNCDRPAHDKRLDRDPRRSGPPRVWLTPDL